MMVTMVTTIMFNKNYYNLMATLAIVTMIIE